MEAKMRSFELQGEAVTVKAALDSENKPYYLVKIEGNQVYTGDVNGLSDLFSRIYSDLWDYRSVIDLSDGQTNNRSILSFEADWGEHDADEKADA